MRPALVHDAAVLDRLWSSVPAGMRLPRLSAGTVPPLYQGGFAEGGPGGTAIDVSGLPGPMRREVTWCVFRVIELGGRIQVHGAAHAGAPAAPRSPPSTGAAGPRSLTDLPARAWLQQIPHGRPPPAGEAARRVIADADAAGPAAVPLRLLDLAYDARPWWQRESWHPVEDPRVPVRTARAAGPSRCPLSPDHGRRGCAGPRSGTARSRLETGLLRWSTLGQRVFALTVFDAFLAAWAARRAAAGRRTRPGSGP